MFLAAWEGQPEVMRSLIKAGANVDERNKVSALIAAEEPKLWPAHYK